MKYTTYVTSTGLRSRGLVVRAVACEARGPGFYSSSDQMFFFSPQVNIGRNKMDKTQQIACSCASMY